MLAPIARTAVVAGLACTFALSAVAETTVSVKINADRPGAVINKNIYGQFAEHLGRGIYEGIWVGPDSKIANTRGFRNDVIEALKELHVPLIRWPGGCFADEYHWRNGIGPHKDRPVTVNASWGNVTDNNAFGTHEFFDLAEILGSQVYINGNLGTGTPQEMAEWLEYMTSPSQSTLANLRRKNGREEPWKVDFFAIGNESWGCGGNMTPEYYTHLYKHYATFLKTPEDNRPVLIASGGYDSHTDWTETLVKNVKENFSLRMQGIGHHYYTLPLGNWEKKGKATGFPEEEWLSTFVNTLKIEGFIKSNVAIMDKHDPEKKVGFFVDEWGTWYDTEEGDNPSFLHQQNTLRDALVAALNFNVFHKYSERVQMTNIAQMVNVLQAMIMTDGPKMVLTPTYHVFRLYLPFQDATYVPVRFEAGLWTHGNIALPRMDAIAAQDKDGTLWLALTNVDPSRPVQIDAALASGRFRSASGETLTAARVDSVNTFEAPDVVTPRPLQASVADGRLRVTLPPKSVSVIALRR